MLHAEYKVVEYKGGGYRLWRMRWVAQSTMSPQVSKSLFVTKGYLCDSEAPVFTKWFLVCLWIRCFTEREVQDFWLPRLAL